MHSNRNRRFLPGDNVRWFAERNGWTLSRRTIFVEGESDVRYLKLAAKLYFDATSFCLLGEDLGVAAIGQGDEGGTLGMIEKFPALCQIIKNDLSPNGRQLYRAIALLDGDEEGEKTCNYLVSRHRNFELNRDVFVLRRCFPRDTRDHRALERRMTETNILWHKIACEIEDLLGHDLIDAFIADNPKCTIRPTVSVNGESHYDFTDRGKSSLCRWAQDYASLVDVTKIVEIIKSIRYYLGLDHDV